ncbi:complex I subunit 4 family protein [Buchnera aphidicola]|uniref:NADH-quinone oxidoreductase subunit M n=1 Tax=Buchnera aphidicola subsp. Tuberolachnus salignus TaxID=98804 RepID=A0A170PBM2_BUCTT|nr:NADH-quinone oxidoreductase subunit M [Buchnera aphidicola]CUR53099.1 NADH-quinone oxidoreductase subunit M [Buchnera aphidicola (Tuberolachnus salignus)]
MLLLFFIVVPFFSSIICLLFFNKKTILPFFITLLTSVGCLIVSIYIFYKKFFLLNNLSNNSLFLLDFQKIWLPEFGISFHLRLDSLSLLMIILTSLISCIAVMCDWNINYKNSGLFYFYFLLTILGFFGVFLSEDLFLFFLFWELTIFPLYFLILYWHNEELNIQFVSQTIKKFFVYSQISGMFLLISILYLVQEYYNLTGLLTFDYLILQKVILPFNKEFFLMLGFFLAFIIKMPIFPFQDWYSNIHLCTPASGSIDILGFLLKTSLYGFLRFNLCFFPNVLSIFFKIGNFLSFLTIFYNIFLVYTQNNIKKIITSLSMIHIGIIFLALNNINQFSYQGMFLYFVSCTLITSALFIIIKNLKENFNTYNIFSYIKLSQNFTSLSSFFLFFLLINIGIPGTGNFSGEILILLGSFLISPILVSIVVFNLLFLVGFILKIIVSMYYGPENKVSFIQKNVFFSYILLYWIIFLIFLIGIFPQIVFNFSTSWFTFISQKNLFFLI